MKSRFLVVMAVLFVWVSQCWAQNYIILFKQQELSITTLEHDGLQQLLQSTNQQSVTQLNQWFGTTSKSKTAPVVTDLWLVRGALADITDDVATQLGQQAWVQAETQSLTNIASNTLIGHLFVDNRIYGY